MSLAYTPESVEVHRRKLDRLKASLDHARRSCLDAKEALKKARTRLNHAGQAQRIVQAVAEGVQQQAHRRIAAVVTRCLKAVFGDDAYEFRIDFSQKRGKTEAEFKLVRDGLAVDPADAAGGGVVDVAAFALRLACLLLSVPRRRKLLVLDEPFKHLSKSYRPAVRQLLKAMAEEMGVQMIVVTHDPMLQIGKVIEL